MPNPGWITVILIYLLLPGAGVAAFLVLLRHLHRAGIANVLALPFFLIQTFYGGLLLIVLTGLYLPWSGMASLGVLACLFLGPILMLSQAWRLWKMRRESNFHRVAFVLTLAYPLCLGGLIMVAQRVVT